MSLSLLRLGAGRRLDGSGDAFLTFVVAHAHAQIAAMRRLDEDGGFLQAAAGLATFPIFAAADWPSLKTAWKTGLPGLAGAVLKPRPAMVTHGITHHRYRLRLAEAALAGGAEDAALPPGYAWVPEQALDRILVSSLPRKIRRALEAGR